jgi:hypothetical protein
MFLICKAALMAPPNLLSGCPDVSAPVWLLPVMSVEAFA